MVMGATHLMIGDWFCYQGGHLKMLLSLALASMH
jgi:hypothetical protein